MKKAVALVLYSVVMYGVYVAANWGITNIGVWIVLPFFAICLAAGFWIDHNDKKSLSR